MTLLFTTTIAPQLWGVFLPLLSAVICTCLLLIRRLRFGMPTHAAARNIQRMMLLYFVTVGANWILFSCYIFQPVLYTALNPLYYWGLLAAQVLFYHLTCLLTATHDDKPFPVIHYLIPALIVAILVVWYFMTPFEVSLTLVISHGNVRPEGYEWYSRFFLSRMNVRGVYSIIYAFLGLRRIVRYQRAVANYSANDRRTSLLWLRWLLLLMLLIIPTPLVSLFFPKEILLRSATMLIPFVVMAVQLPILYRNLVRENYVLIVPEKKKTAPTPKRKYMLQASPEEFDRWMLTKKPYLNPELTIDDLALMQGTNRDYLSQFINRTYGMNFRRYINHWRLQEMARLEAEEGRQSGTHGELPLWQQVGFGNRKSWLRTKAYEEGGL